MDIPLPPPGQLQSPDDHMQISRRFIEHAKEELRKGERLQASEKVYGRAQHALSAVGKERGWATHNYYRKEDVLYHLIDEFGLRDESGIDTLAAMHASFGFSHLNFHENSLSAEAIERAVSNVEVFVNTIQDLRELGPRPFTVMNESQASRIRRLTGRVVVVGDSDPAGFVNPVRLAEYSQRWSENGDDVGPLSL